MEEKVTFTSEGKKIAGLLFIPDNYKKGAKHPALVFDGPMTGLKDQVVAVYARKLAKKGYLCLTFDHRFYGESEGEPRQLESPLKKIQDIHNAVSYLLSRSDVDPERLGAVGVCAGGGHMVRALAIDYRVKAFAGIAACYHDPNSMKRWIGEDGYKATIERSRKAEEKYQETGEVEYVPAVSADPRDMNAAMPTEEPYAYYGTARGYSPNYVNLFAVMGYEGFMTFNAKDSAKDITVPTIIIHGTRDNFCTPEGARDFYNNLKVTKDIFWIETTNHIDLYDQDKYVDQAVERGELVRPAHGRRSGASPTQARSCRVKCGI